jgi:hypothetical protein
VISPSQRPLPDKHTTLTTDKHPCPRRNSNPQSQQTSGCRPTTQTARLLGSATLLLLHTAIGLSPGGSSPTLVHTKIKIHKTTNQLQNIKITQNNKTTANHQNNTKQQNNYKTMKINTRWFKYDGDYLCVNKSQFVPVIFEPPCT